MREGHPIAGASWEGFVIENLLRVVPERTKPSFYRTSGGAGIDLVLELAGGEMWAVEIKRGLVPRLERGFTQAREDLKPARSFIVYSGSERYPLKPGVEAVRLWGLAEELAGL